MIGQSQILGVTIGMLAKCECARPDSAQHDPAKRLRSVVLLPAEA